MKLIKLNDNELNAAFAEKVAGWREVSNGPLGWDGIDPDMPRHSDGSKLFSQLPRFTESADIVLPWLEKYGPYVGAEIFSDGWHITISNYELNNKIGVDKSFARAACIAILRDKGVLIEA